MNYKVIVSPTLINFFIKNEDGSASLADYTLFSNISLDKQYGGVILKAIRFSLCYPIAGAHNADGYVFHPYQVHLRWVDDTDPNFQPGKIVQNPVYDTTTGLLLVESNPSSTKPSYSTFCQFDTAIDLTEPNQPASEFNHGDIRFLHYNLIRNALIKEGSFSSLGFEIFFTNLRGQRMYRYLPNVEIEFEMI